MGLLTCLLPGGPQNLEAFLLESSPGSHHVQLSHFTGRESEAGKGRGLGAKAL